MPQYVDVPKYDENEDIRDYCTCPNCHIIWPHYETAKMPCVWPNRSGQFGHDFSPLLPLRIPQNGH